MPVDIAAEVIGNDRLSSDYNVVGWRRRRLPRPPRRDNS